jgi:hypothetical protein
VCNPVTGQLFRLPDPDFLKNGENFMMPPTGLLTQADGGHGPPKRYAAVDLIDLPSERRLLLCRFSSDTGEYNTARGAADRAARQNAKVQNRAS